MLAVGVTVKVALGVILFVGVTDVVEVIDGVKDGVVETEIDAVGVSEGVIDGVIEEVLDGVNEGVIVTETDAVGVLSLIHI